MLWKITTFNSLANLLRKRAENILRISPKIKFNEKTMIKKDIIFVQINWLNLI